MSANEFALQTIAAFRGGAASAAGTALPGRAHPAYLAPDGRLRAVLERRTANRAFRPVPLDLGALLECVAAGWDDDDCCPLEAVLVALRVNGLDPGIYRIGGEAAEFAAPIGDPQQLVLQREFAAAGAIIAAIGDVQGATDRHGGHGYRLLMTRAGSVIYGTWLAAISRGMGGSVFAGFLPAAIRRPMRCDGVTRHQLFAVALGEVNDDTTRR